MRQLAAAGKVAALYAGGVIGAGFASGQEILQFFALLGPGGLLGTALAAWLFAYLGAVVLGMATGLHSTSYRRVIDRLLGPRLGALLDLVSLLVLFGGLGVMLAGSGAVAQQQFDLPPAVGVLGLAILTSLVIYRGLVGVIEVNVLVVPIKVLTVAAISVYAILAGLVSVVIWLAIFTTAVAEAHGFAARLAAPGTASYRLYGIGAVICALPLTCAGFPSLVRFFYPLFGYTGLLLIVPLAFAPLAGIRCKIKKYVRTSHGGWLR